MEIEQESDGRWIAEVPELNILLYGQTEQDAVQRAQIAVKEIIEDRIAHGELPPTLSLLLASAAPAPDHG